MLLHELLVAIAISGVILSAAYGVFEQGLRAHAVGAARVEAHQAARAALFRMSAEIRDAGRGARWTAAAVAVAEPSRIVLASDLDNDGTTNDRGELITWQLVGSVLRRNGGAGAGAQPVANGVSALALRYFDVAGLPTTIPSAVTTVDITLVVQPTTAASSLARGTAATVNTRVRLRNR